MIEILPLSSKIEKLLKKYFLVRKFKKQLNLLSQNPRHPGLRLELLEPKKHGIYSFRIDRKFRALCFFRPDKNALEIFAITKHYHKKILSPEKRHTFNNFSHRLPNITN